jgi:hypothetical protein
MSGDENVEEDRRQLYQAVKTHASNIEIARSFTSDLDLEVLDRRIEATRLLLEWLSQAPGLGLAAFPEVRTPLPLSALADQDQIPLAAHDTPKTRK